VFLKVLEKKSLMCVTWIDFPPYFTMNHKPTYSHCLSECLVPKCFFFFSFSISYWKLSYVLCICNVHGLAQRSRYSDSLQAGQSDDRTTVGVRFSVPHLTSPALGPTQPPIQWVLGLFFPGVKWLVMVLTTPLPS